MTLEELIAVSGLPGLYKMVANRPNGLVVEEIDSGKRRFCSVRRHQFTPLGSVAIYTIDDTVPLTDVLQSMKEREADVPIPEVKSDTDELYAYFGQILPRFDTERVYASDIKKVIRWYSFLTERDLLDDLLNPAGDEEE